MPVTPEADSKEGHPSARGQQTKDGDSGSKASGEDTLENPNIFHVLALHKLHSLKTRTENPQKADSSSFSVSHFMQTKTFN